MDRLLKVGLLGLLLAMLLVYIGDIAVFEVRVRRGTAYRTIEIDQFLRTPLKGQKEEYDAVGSVQVTCARTVFPRPDVAACWWLERHKTQWQ